MNLKKKERESNIMLEKNMNMNMNQNQIAMENSMLFLEVAKSSSKLNEDNHDEKHSETLPIISPSKSPKSAAKTEEKKEDEPVKSSTAGSSKQKPSESISFSAKVPFLPLYFRGWILLMDQGKLEKVNTAKLGQELLTPKEIFVLDYGGEVFVCTGKGSQGIDLGNRKTSWARFSKEADGAESILFKEKFWNFKDDLTITSKAKVKSKIATKRGETFSVSHMSQHNKVECFDSEST
eukprot:TRINITY_DN1077_c0_g1_i3.p1 TRINITY_DN1077_c0_g1~~TRINITY_DN1077_c0_g1_i3.p1  ORF type:complete len:236 (-),score=65.12 TRINITY_DN1077_c0_g1_i3:189-896(-)